MVALCTPPVGTQRSICRPAAVPHAANACSTLGPASVPHTPKDAHVNDLKLTFHVLSRAFTNYLIIQSHLYVQMYQFSAGDLLLPLRRLSAC
jgi:hypothetical protein